MADKKRGASGQRGGARPGAGAPRGMRKATIERMEQARLHELARNAELEVEKAKKARTKLGKEVIEEFMFLFAGMAAFYQPTPPGASKNVNESEGKFVQYATLAVDAAAELAKYQSPTFKAIAVSATPPPPPAAQPGDNAKVINLNDAAALGVAYRRMVTASAK